MTRRKRFFAITGIISLAIWTIAGNVYAGSKFWGWNSWSNFEKFLQMPWYYYLFLLYAVIIWIGAIRLDRASRRIERRRRESYQNRHKDDTCA